MPLPILGLTLLFSLVPFLSCILFESPAAAFDRAGLAYAAALVLAYWIAPLAISAALLFKHHWFLPFYILQCAGLILHTILAHDQAAEIQFARVVLIGLMFYVGVLIGNRNFLYPLLTKQFRFWRRSIRFRVGRAIAVASDPKETGTPALLFDCSAGGVQLAFHVSDLPGNMRHFFKGNRFEIRVPAEQEAPEMRIEMEVAWAAEADTSIRVGCRALNKTLMRTFVRTERKKQKLAAQLPMPKGFVIDQDIHQTALVLWLVCIALSFALPAFA